MASAHLIIANIMDIGSAQRIESSLCIITKSCWDFIVGVMMWSYSSLSNILARNFMQPVGQDRNVQDHAV